MTSKVNMSFDQGKDGIQIATVNGGEYKNEKLYLHTGENHGGSKKKGVKELEIGKNFLSKLSPRKQSEVMLYLQEAFKRGIPPEHLNLSIPGAEEAYRELYGGSKDEKPTTKIKLPPGSTFALMPSTKPDTRQVWYIAGASGSGKSYIAKHLAETYLKQFPGREVYLISKLKEDETLDSMKPPPSRLNLEKLAEKPITDLEIFRDCMLIFDDYDTITGKEGKAVQQLIDDVAIQGRHQNVYMLCLTHYLSNYKKTRLMLTEATHFVLYPQSTGSHALNYLLKTYLGLGTKEVAALKKTGSRWLCIHKNFPIYYITETEAGLLNQDEEEE